MNLPPKGRKLRRFPRRHLIPLRLRFLPTKIRKGDSITCTSCQDYEWSYEEGQGSKGLDFTSRWRPTAVTRAAITASLSSSAPIFKRRSNAEILPKNEYGKYEARALQNKKSKENKSNLFWVPLCIWVKYENSAHSQFVYLQRFFSSRTSVNQTDRARGVSIFQFPLILSPHLTE